MKQRENVVVASVICLLMMMPTIASARFTIKTGSIECDGKINKLFEGVLYEVRCSVEDIFVEGVCANHGGNVNFNNQPQFLPGLILEGSADLVDTPSGGNPGAEPFNIVIDLAGAALAVGYCPSLQWFIPPAINSQGAILDEVIYPREANAFLEWQACQDADENLQCDIGGDGNTIFVSNEIHEDDVTCRLHSKFNLNGASETEDEFGELLIDCPNCPAPGTSLQCN